MKMNTLKNKLSKKSGFTLVEMLIVVAIIAILIAISIPLINSALEKARDNTDNANWRSAKAEATLLMLGVAETAEGELIDIPTSGTSYWYDAAKGVLVEQDGTNTKPQAYGQCTKQHAGSGNDDPFASMKADLEDTDKNETGPHVNKVVQIDINPVVTTGEKWLTMSWV